MKLLIMLFIVASLLLTACSYNLPVSATSNPMGEKTGRFTQTSILGFPPPLSDAAAIQEAAKNGGITKISTVNFNQKWKFFIFEYETIVTGE